MIAGRCVACQADLWVRVTHPKTGAAILLYPLAGGVYARVATAIGIAPGIGYCRACAPPVGSPGPAGEVVQGRQAPGARACSP